MYYCASGAVRTQTCAAGQMCGWNARGNYYDCMPPPATPAPGGNPPMACATSQ
jgi:hypothetical protein